ncbi:MAG TPA: hypothetical protein IAA77_05530 [Candidatus Avibacteroides excrementipullorum]|jgi:hypothetical protein|nr:hypothetical protein [Candidatus Avibacteroides excrementipullorum]
MKKKQNLFVGLVAALLLSSCSQEELGEQGMALPEGEYPLQIGSVTLTAEVSEQPWTRVVESTDGMSSVWEGDEQIGVQIGSGQPGIYTVQDDGSVVAINPVYWTSTAPTYVTAWYPTNETVDLSNQSNGLAYVLEATQDPVTYEQSVTLNFTHKLAKVRVVLNGTQAGQVESVEIYGITACNHLGGSLDYEASNTGWIKMKKQTFADGTECWEANVVPGEVISQIKVNNTEATLTKPLTPKVAALNTITINVEQAPTEIDLDAYEGTTLTVSGKTTIKGNGQQKNLQITVAPDTELTLQNVNLSYKGSAPVVFKGDATLTLEGANTLEGECVAWDFNSGSGIYIEQGTLTINADNENASLTISRKYNMKPNSSAGMGICVPENASLIIKSGKITINDVDSEGDSSGAGIGTSGETCGNITIEGGNITVGKCSWYTAGIGSLNGDCKGITITGENTVVNVSKGDYASCYIGSGIGTVTGNITIGDGATVNGVKYTETHTGTL